jgi:hypothetical protein
MRRLTTTTTAANQKNFSKTVSENADNRSDA